MADRIMATCTTCNGALNVVDKDDDTSEVSCPSCGTGFGKWGDVKAKLKELLADKFKDHPWISVT